MLEDIKQKLPELTEKVNNLNRLLKIPQLKEKAIGLEEETTEPGFWDNSSRARIVMRELNIAKRQIEWQQTIGQKLADVNVLCEIAGENKVSEAELQAIDDEFNDLEKEIIDYELVIVLSGKYDTNNAIFSIAAGAGGTDAQDWAQMLLRMYTRWFEKRGYKVQEVDLSPGEEAGIKGVTLIVEGDYAYGYLHPEAGIHRLVRLSPFNANNKRQTSFASVEVIPEVDLEVAVEIDPEDLRIDTFRASGAGGQHVNRTDSAVRITHLPTGIVVQCQNERSQLQNKETALKVLTAKLVKCMEEEHKEKISEIKGQVKEIAWGHQIRSYVFHPYSMVKDHRTGLETSDVSGVMDGDIDAFAEAYLRKEGGKNE
ncbi:MAG: peptide chain release factor 2 [Candidatus Margulisiibacteriota bacterium]